MPFGETQVEEFKWGGRRYEITIWPNDQQDIEVENRFLPVVTSRNSDEYNTAGTIVALGIFNYSVPWLDWYVRSHPRFTKRPWASNDVWTEVTMIERERMSGDESVDYMEMTDKERLYHKDWKPKDDRSEKNTGQMMARLKEQETEFDVTNITYLTIRDMGSLVFPPLNWPYTPLYEGFLP